MSVLSGYMKNVSRETFFLLEKYYSFLKQWHTKHNLISENDLIHFWNRHILDCAQIALNLKKNHRIIVDMGSGAGFPAIVIAILMRYTDKKFILLEKNSKKCVFLKTVIYNLKLNAVVINVDFKDI